MTAAVQQPQLTNVEIKFDRPSKIYRLNVSTRFFKKCTVTLSKMCEVLQNVFIRTLSVEP